MLTYKNKSFPFIASTRILVGMLVLVGLGGCTSNLQLKNQDGTSLPVSMEAFPVDQNKSAPTVLISHGSDGVQRSHKEWATRVQSWGYNAVVIDHYSMRGISHHTGQVLPNMRGEDRARDLVKAGHWISNQPWHKGKIAAIGFSQGGAGVLVLGGKRENLEFYKILKEGEANPYAVAIAFYPACGISSPSVTPSMPIQLHLAMRDGLALVSHCSPIDDPLYEVHRYKDATHAFDVSIPSSMKLSFSHHYDLDIAEQSRKKTRDFLDKHLK